MKPNDVAKRMLPYIGVYTLDLTANQSDPNKRALQQSDLDFMAGCMTAALGEVWQDGPASMSETRYGTILHGPTVFTADVTSGSATITQPSTWADWMIGCTCRLGSDANDNEFTSATTLLRPYMGATASISGTTWGDAVKLPELYDVVLDPVKIPLLVPLVMASSREDFDQWGGSHSYSSSGYGSHQPGYRHGDWFMQMNKTVAQPRVWFAETRQTEDFFLPVFLHVNPMPSIDYALTLRVKLRPVTITAANLGDANTAPSIPIPVNWHENIFMPYALQRFTAHPSFSNLAAKAEIARQYASAKQFLQGYSPSGGAVFGHYR